MKSTKNALEIHKLKKVYDNGFEAVKGINLDIPEGSFYALLGPNGAGKSTTIGVATGLIRPTTGSIKIFGYDIAKDPVEAKSKIGIVAQEFNFGIFETVIDIVLTQGGYYGIPKSVALPIAEKRLKELGLWEKRNDQARMLSGGMKRRLMIARALIHEPKLLILDEPTAGVDIELRRGMWEFLRKLNASGVTIVLTTHYLEEAEALCDRVAIINKGQIVKEGSMKDLLKGLNEESYILEIREDVTELTLEKLKQYEPQKTKNGVEITLGKKDSICDAMETFKKSGYPVHRIRNKTNRLEELFLRITQD